MKYYNDLWAFDVDSLKWQQCKWWLHIPLLCMLHWHVWLSRKTSHWSMAQPNLSQRIDEVGSYLGPSDVDTRAVGDITSGAWPSPRSGCQLALHENALFVVGGYSKVQRPNAWG